MTEPTDAQAEKVCPRCEGDGKAHGSDRPFEWKGPGTYPGPCPVCKGSGKILGQTMQEAVDAANAILVHLNSLDWEGEAMRAEEMSALNTSDAYDDVMRQHLTANIYTAMKASKDKWRVVIKAAIEDLDGHYAYASDNLEKLLGES